MFSSRTRSALFIMTVILEADKKQDKRLRQSDIAEALGLSVSGVELLVKDLRAADLIEGKKGPGGGLFIERDPAFISVAEIAIAMEGNVKPGKYPLISEVINKAMQSVHLSDLMEGA